MKKTTKFLLVLAAVVAMTIGAVSTVMAADVNYVTIDTSTWDCTDGWYAKDTKGNQIVTGWAVDENNHWYYFSSKKAVENAFIIYRGELYYFGRDCIMAEGWVKFTEDNAAPVLAVDADGYCAGEVLLNGDNSNPYGDVVWCFFEKGGAAARNKWVDDGTGLWYYFEDVVMVSDNYMYMPAGEDVYYGFSGDGNMHVGWIKATGKYNVERPYESSANCWLYYNTNGSMANAGWKKIDGSWYYFVANTTTSKYAGEEFEVPEGASVLLTNVFAEVDPDKSGVYYYFNDNGVMQTGSTTIAKSKYVRTSIAQCLSGANGTRNTSSAFTYLFASDGALKTGAQGSNYYLKANDTAIYQAGTYAVDVKEIELGTPKSNTLHVGEMVYNCFRINSGKVMYYDATGTLVKNSVVTFGGVTIAFDGNGYAKVAESPETGVYVAGRYYYFSDAFGSITVGGITIPGCSVRKASTISAATGSAINVN